MIIWYRLLSFAPFNLLEEKKHIHVLLSALMGQEGTIMWVFTSRYNLS